MKERKSYGLSDVFWHGKENDERSGMNGKIIIISKRNAYKLRNGIQFWE